MFVGVHLLFMSENFVSIPFNNYYILSFMDCHLHLTAKNLRKKEHIRRRLLCILSFSACT